MAVTSTSTSTSTSTKTTDEDDRRGRAFRPPIAVPYNARPTKAAPMISRPALRRASRLLATALGLLSSVAPTLGCALAVGVEDVSGTPIDDFSQRCVDETNAFRILHHLGTVERWLEIEPCAAEVAEDRAAETTPPRTHGKVPNTSDDCHPEACSRRGDSMAEILTKCLSDDSVLERGENRSKLACTSYRKDDDEGVVLFFYK
jgi:hypothetical protein